MRFISKSSNLLVVLSPGLPAQPLTGTPAKPTVSVRFKDGFVDVPDGELTKLMLAHPGFNGDFISTEITDKDPYAATRSETEPAHVVTSLKYGTPVSRDVYGAKATLPPELQKIVQEAATAIAKEMLPGMLQSALKSLVAGHEASKEEKVKGKPGRPARAAKTETPAPSPEVIPTDENEIPA